MILRKINHLIAYLSQNELNQWTVLQNKDWRTNTVFFQEQALYFRYRRMGKVVGNRIEKGLAKPTKKGSKEGVKSAFDF